MELPSPQASQFQNSPAIRNNYNNSNSSIITRMQLRPKMTFTMTPWTMSNRSTTITMNRIRLRIPWNFWRISIISNLRYWKLLFRSPIIAPSTFPTPPPIPVICSVLIFVIYFFFLFNLSIITRLVLINLNFFFCSVFFGFQINYLQKFWIIISKEHGDFYYDRN